MKINNVIILGGHIQALGLARQAHKIGVEVILVLQDDFSVARFSRAVRKTIVCTDINKLKEALQPYAGMQTLLFPTSDEYIEFLTDNYTELYKQFILGIPKPACVEIFANKRKTYPFAEEKGIPHPMSWFPKTIDDVKKIAKDMKSPLIIKPGIMYSFHKTFGKKAFKCDTPKELLSISEKIALQYPLDSLVIQEFLTGGSEVLYSFGALAMNGEPLAWVTANRIRQNPIDFGNSTTFAITCNIPEIEIIARKILKEVNYDGLAEVEFMYDETLNTYKFLEINTRAWKWHSISTGLGFGFLSDMIHYYNGEKGDFNPEFKKCAWVERLTDFAVSLKCILKGRLKLNDILSSYNQKKVNAVWSIKDPLPAIMYLLMSPILFVKRH